MRRALQIFAVVGLVVCGPAVVRAQDALGILEKYSRLLVQGSQELAQGRYAEAQRTLEEAVRINPGNPLAPQQLAQALYFQGRIDEAIGVLLVANAATETSRAHVDLAFFYLRKGDPGRALPHAERAVRLEPKSWLTHARLGECRHALGRYGDAIDAYKKSNALQENSTSHLSIGWALLAQKKRAEAFKSFERAAELDSDAAWVLYDAKAGIEREEGRPEAAAAYLALAIDAATLEPVKSRLTDDLVALYLELGDHRRAAALYGDRRWLGVVVSPVAKGMEISGVVKNGPADLAGLRPGDVITEFEGLPLAGVAPARFSSETVGGVPHGGTAIVKIEREGLRLERAVVVGLSPDLPRLAAEASSGKPAATPSPELSPAPPAVVITGLSVDPSPVPPGGDFSVEVRFMVTVPSGPAELPLSLACAISRLGETVYEPPPDSFEAPNGKPFEVRKKLAAGTGRGDYSVRVRLAWQSVSVEKSVDFAIK